MQLQSQKILCIVVHAFNLNTWEAGRSKIGGQKRSHEHCRLVTMLLVTQKQKQKTGGKALLLNYVIKYGKVKLVPSYTLPSYCTRSWKVLCMIVVRKVIIKSLSYKCCNWQELSACRIYWSNSGTNVMGATNHILNLVVCFQVQIAWICTWRLPTSV